MCTFQTSCFSPNWSPEHAQLNFGKPTVTLLPKIRKTFPNCKNVEVTIFWTKFFFHQKRFFINRECIFDNLPKTFLQKSTDLPLRFRKRRKKFWIFQKQNKLPQNVPMYMYNAVVTTLPKNSRQNSENHLLEVPEMMKKLCAFQTKLFLLKMFVGTCTMNFWQDCRNFVAKNTKHFPELQKCWSYIFLNKTFFSSKTIL